MGGKIRIVKKTTVLKRRVSMKHFVWGVLLLLFLGGLLDPFSL